MVNPEKSGHIESRLALFSEKFVASGFSESRNHKVFTNLKRRDAVKLAFFSLVQFVAFASSDLSVFRNEKVLNC